MGSSPTEYAEFTEPPTEMSSHGFLLRRVWHLAIPTPPAMGYSPTEYAEFTEPPAEMSSHGFLLRRVWQGCHTLLICAYPCHLWEALLCKRFREFRAFCGNLFPPTDFTDLHRYLGCAVLPQNSQNLAAWVWQGCHTLLHLCASVSSVGGSSLPEVSVRSVRSVGISFLPRISQIYTDTYGALFSHRIHRIHRIWQRGYGRDAIPSYICEHPCHLWESFLCQKFPCVPCVLWEYLFSHGFHRATQMLRVRCSPTEYRICQRGYGRDPYPPTSVRIRVICGRLFSARGSVYSVYSVGASSPLVLLVQRRLLHPLAESTEVVCKSHHLTISPQQHHFTSNPAFCMSSQYCGYDFVTTCGSLMRSPGNTIAAGANAIAMRWSS